MGHQWCWCDPLQHPWVPHTHQGLLGYCLLPPLVVQDMEGDSLCSVRCRNINSHLSSDKCPVLKDNAACISLCSKVSPKSLWWCSSMTETFLYSSFCSYHHLLIICCCLHLIYTWFHPVQTHPVQCLAILLPHCCSPESYDKPNFPPLPTLCRNFLNQGSYHLPWFPFIT